MTGKPNLLQFYYEDGILIGLTDIGQKVEIKGDESVLRQLYHKNGIYLPETR